MQLAEPAPQRLAEVMPNYSGLWRDIVAHNDLLPYSMETLIGASWQFADAVFGYGGSPHDTIVSTVKARQFGFADCVDTDAMFVRQLSALQAARVLPR
jgi:hypothetical protein